MNKTKRKLELISAIIAIIASYLTLNFSMIFLSEITKIHEYNNQFDVIVAITTFFIAITIIVFASMLCTKPIKNGFQKKRKWIYIILWILFPLLILINISIIAQTRDTVTLIMSIFLLITYIFLIITTNSSAKLEHDIPYKDKQDYIKKSKIEQKIKYLDELRTANKITEENYKELINKYLENL